LTNLATRAFRRLENTARIRLAAQSVRRNAPHDVEAAIDYAFHVKPGTFDVAPIQVRSELLDFLLLVQQLKPRAVVEIGTARGGTLFLFTRVAAPDAILVSVDLSSAEDTRFAGGNVARRRPLYESFALDQQQVHFVVGDSHEEETVARVREALAGRAADLLFVDGDHTSEGVRRDYELYRALVRPGGMIAFHDIVTGTPEFVGGVPEFWESVKTAEARELVENRGQGGFGIGVLPV
jgi:cephalosporin hydroxylase